METTTSKIPVLKKSAIEKAISAPASTCCTPKENASACCTPHEPGKSPDGACCPQPADGSACCNK